jgi:ATP dependent DNA ligase C terminal region
MIDLARLTKKSGDYAFGPRAAITDRVLMEVAGQYDVEVSNRFIAIKPADLPSRYGPDSRVLETTKYDGEGVFVYFEAGRSPDIFTFNAPSGRARVGLPCLKELSANLKARGTKKALLRAELYLRETVDGRRCASSDVTRASYSNDPADAGRFRLAILDVIMHDGRDLRAHQSDFLTIWKLIGELAGTNAEKLVHRSEGSEVSGADLAKVFDQKTSGGLEGLVIRRLDRAEVCKLKPRRTVDAAVVGFVEGEFEGNYGMMSLLTALAYPANERGLQLQSIARVGSGFNDQDRIDWLGRLSTLRVDAPLAMSDSDGRPVRFVKPGFVVEVEAEDILPADEEASGQQVFGWNKTRWSFDGLAACPRLLLPTFHRLRPDKDFTPQAVRIAQLTSREIMAPELINRDLPPLEVMRREVYTKEVKGALAVRKLVVGRRPATAGAFPYVIFWTDFSSGRKTPLEVTTLFAHTETRAQALVKKLIEENVTKGFDLHGAPKPVASPAPSEAESADAKPKKKAVKKKATEGE